ncbi:MAG: hypothetical protein ACFFDH_04265 [Promethearchaeota archaeon]
MELNWTLEVISTFIAGSVLLITAILPFHSKKVSKLRSIFYLKLVWYFVTLFFYIESLSYLFLSIFLNRLHSLLLIPPTIFLICSINYTTKETIYSKNLILLVGAAVLYVYLVFQPESFVISYKYSFYTIKWMGLFDIVAGIFQVISLVYLFIWGYRTWKNAPFLIKREASIFFIGTSLSSVVVILLFLLHYRYYQFMIVFNLVFSIGILISSIALMKQPKLLYILPFTLCRISVKDREGYPLFDHDWSESKVSELVFTGFINAVQLMSQEIIRMGGLLDIKLQEGIVIMHESENITVGLVSSKSSKVVRESLVNFTRDFEIKFQKQLKEKSTNMKDYEIAYELIEKYFSNFPSRIISSKRQPLLLQSKYTEIPKALDNKLRSIFPDEEEYESIKSELMRAPLFTSEEFFDIYNELKDEIDKLENNTKK